jgi:hypothetical protein
VRLFVATLEQLELAYNIYSATRSAKATPSTNKNKTSARTNERTNRIVQLLNKVPASPYSSSQKAAPSATTAATMWPDARIRPYQNQKVTMQQQQQQRLPPSRDDFAAD